MIAFYWVVEYLGSFIDTLMCCIFCGIFIGEKNDEYRKKIFLYSLIGAAIITGLNTIKTVSFILSFSFMIMYIIIQWVIYRQKQKFAILLVFLYGVIITAVEFVVVYVTLFLTNQSSIEDKSPTRYVCMVISKVLLVLVIMIIDKIVSKRRIISGKYAAIIGCVAFFIFASNFSIIYLGLKQQDSNVALISTIFFVADMILGVLLLYFILKLADSYEKQKNIELVEMQNRMLSKSLEDTERAFDLWRESIHNYKNNIITLAQLVEEESTAEIKKYLNNEIQQLGIKTHYAMTGNKVIDAVLATKKNSAEHKGINFYADGNIPDKCIVDEIDFTNIIGNLLDNAIEAAEKVENGNVSIVIKPQKKFIIIKVKNSYDGNKNNELQTTKKDKEYHGIGLKSIKRIVEKYQGEFELEFEEKEVEATALLLNV